LGVSSAIAAPAKDPACQALLKATSFRASFTLQVNHKDRFPMGQVTMVHDYNRSGTGQVTLTAEKDNPGVWRAIDQPAALVANERDGMSENGAEAVRRIQSRGAVTGYAKLFIDCEQGTYGFSAGVESAESTETLVPPPNVTAFCNDKAGGSELICGLAGVDTTPKVRSGLSLSMRIQDEPMRGQRTLSGTRKVTSNVRAFNNSEIEGTFTWSLIPVDGADAKVTLDGCADLETGKNGTVTATGTPAGGTYRFKADPASIMSVTGKGAQAKLRATAPGAGTISVEYTVAGKTVTGSVPASSVQLDSVNGGKPLPKLTLFDERGNPRSEVQSVPLVTKPANSDRLSFEVSDPGIATVVNLGNQLQLQGVREGSVTVQPRTRCKEPIGKAIPLQVVRCADAVVEQLRQRERTVRGRLDSNRKQQVTTTSDEGFDRAANRIGDSTYELGLKTAELIASVLTARGLATENLQKANEIYDFLNMMNDAARKGEWEKAAVQAVVTATQSARLGAMKTLGEAAIAANQFGEDLGELAGAADRLDELQTQERVTEKELNEVWRHLYTICNAKKDGTKEGSGNKTSSGGNPDSPKTGSSTPSSSTPAKTPEPSTNEPSPTEPSTTEPSTTEPSTTEPSTTTSEPPPSDKPGDTTPPGKSKPKKPARKGKEGWPLCLNPDGRSPGDLSQQWAAMKELADSFHSSLKIFGRELTEWNKTVDKVGEANKKAEPQRTQELFKLRPFIESLRPTLKANEELAKTLQSYLKPCPEQLPRGVAKLKKDGAEAGKRK
jgi:hypothetical protein